MEPGARSGETSLKQLAPQSSTDRQPEHPDNGTPSFWMGIKAGFSIPPLMVFTAMIGFGSLAKSQDISLLVSLISAAGIYGMPGQVAMVELYATGASVLAIVVGVAMANMRFLPMSIVLMPLFPPTGGFYRWRYILIQLMSINSWSYVLHVAPDIPANKRFGFFAGFGSMCITGGLSGTALGWILAGSLSTEVTVTLIFLNPAYFIFLFCTNRNRNIIVSIIFGAVLGPLLYPLSPDWSLPACGILAGTLGFWLCRSDNRKSTSNRHG